MLEKPGVGSESQSNSYFLGNVPQDRYYWDQIAYRVLAAQFGFPITFGPSQNDPVTGQMEWGKEGVYTDSPHTAREASLTKFYFLVCTQTKTKTSSA